MVAEKEKGVNARVSPIEPPQQSPQVELQSDYKRRLGGLVPWKGEQRKLNMGLFVIVANRG
jgi:hypothetical protein